MTLPCTKLEIRTCRNCGKAFQPRQQNQQSCSRACHDRRQHNKYRWLVTSVTDGLTGGYAFTVRVGDSQPLAGYFLKSLDGYVRFPGRLVISITKRRRLQKPLRKQVAQIVNTGDSRYRPRVKLVEREPVAVRNSQPKPQVEPTPEPPKVCRWFSLSPCCRQECIKVPCATAEEPDLYKLKCPQCSTEYSLEDRSLILTSTEVEPETVTEHVST